MDFFSAVTAGERVCRRAALGHALPGGHCLKTRPRPTFKECPLGRGLTAWHVTCSNSAEHKETTSCSDFLAKPWLYLSWLSWRPRRTEPSPVTLPPRRLSSEAS